MLKTTFLLSWIKEGQSLSKAFKQSHLLKAAEDYQNRIHNYSACLLSGLPKKKPLTTGSSEIWLCDRHKAKKAISSESLAHQLDRLRQRGTRELKIVIGPPDGFTETDYGTWNANFYWSFGPLTLPHELATVISLEQIYRAWTILNKHPYHLGH